MMDAGWLWLVPAALIVWVLGAYNRMVRLRARVLQAFVAVDNCLVRFTQLVDEHLVPDEVLPVAASWAGLRSASVQLDNNRRVARQRALDAAALAALFAALRTLQVWWARLAAEATLHPGVLPEACRAGWEENQRHTADACKTFNASVLAHNAAVGQFPASLLARLFGFRHAGHL